MPKPRTGTNDIIAAFAANEFQQLFTGAEQVSFAANDILHEAHARITHVYFPQDGLISLLIVLSNDEVAEAGFVGPEGAIGTIYSPAERVAFTRAKAVSAGRAIRVPLDEFESAMSNSPGFRNQINENNFMLTARAQQTAACNLSHHLEARLCRWLLQVFENSESSTVEITQAGLSQMLGVNRARLNEALKVLERIGSVSHARRGELTIVDAGLIADRVCDCYREMRIPNLARRCYVENTDSTFASGNKETAKRRKKDHGDL